VALRATGLCHQPNNRPIHNAYAGQNRPAKVAAMYAKNPDTPQSMPGFSVLTCRCREEYSYQAANYGEA